MLGIIFIGLGIIGSLAATFRATYNKEWAKATGEDVYMDSLHRLRNVYTGEEARRYIAGWGGTFIIGWHPKAPYTKQDKEDMGTEVTIGDDVLVAAHGGMIRNYTAEERIRIRRLYREAEDELTEGAEERAIKEGKTVYLKKLDPSLYYFTSTLSFPACPGNRYIDLDTGRELVKRVIQIDKWEELPQEKREEMKEKGLQNLIWHNHHVSRMFLFHREEWETESERLMKYIVEEEEKHFPAMCYRDCHQIAKERLWESLDDARKEALMKFVWEKQEERKYLGLKAIFVLYDLKKGRYVRIADESLAKMNEEEIEEVNRKIDIHNSCQDEEKAKQGYERVDVKNAEVAYEIIDIPKEGKCKLIDSEFLYSFDMADKGWTIKERYGNGYDKNGIPLKYPFFTWGHHSQYNNIKIPNELHDKVDRIKKCNEELLLKREAGHGPFNPIKEHHDLEWYKKGGK